MFDSIPKLKIEEWSNDAVSTYLVDGEFIRGLKEGETLLDPDFNEGGHDLAPALSNLNLPKGTVIVETDSRISEMQCWFCHELNERNLMAGGMSYDAAHENSNQMVEAGVRAHPETACQVIADLLNNVVETQATKVEVTKMPNEMIRKVFRATIKQVDETNYRVYAQFNTDSRDRDNECCAATSWKKRIGSYIAHPVLVSSHDYTTLLKQIGKVELNQSTIDKSLDGWVSYKVGKGNPEADWAWELAKDGCAAFSVGFKPYESEDGDGVEKARRTFTDNELLEISQVIVPSNREALQAHRSLSAVEEILVKDVLAGMVTKPEVTDNYIRIPADKGDHKGHNIKTIDISTAKGIKGLYCVTDKKVITFMFSTDSKFGWDKAKCEKWVEEHKDGKAYSQGEVKDELDYITAMVKDVGVNADNKALIQKLWRDTGCDKPEPIAPSAKATAKDGKQELVARILGKK